MTSLQGRLFMALAGLVAAAGLLSGFAVYRWAFDEAIELQDGLLVQMGAFLAENRVRPDLLASRDVDPDARVSIAELDGAPIGAGGPLARIPKGAVDGLQIFAAGDELWRVLVRTRLDGSRVAVGQPARARDEIARGSAYRAAAPFAILIPCLMISIALIIHYSFKPVSRLTERLESSETSTPPLLSVAGIPDELRPFILAINHLIGRLTERLGRERRFIADASHELRTPIAALTVQAQNLENAPNDADRARRTGELKAGLRRTAHLLDQLLDHARYASGATQSREPVDVAAIARSAVAELLPLAEAKSIDLGFTRSETALVRIASAAFATIVRNLVGNAIHYLPEGGRIDVAAYAGGGHAVLSVEDDGPGIPPEEIAAVVDPFKRGSSATGQGAGLGLSIVDRIAQAAGGDLSLESPAQGRGLRAIVALPLADPSNPGG